ncbi:MAG: hypothetical protein ABI295_01875 [Xanthomarina sp.]
MNQPVKINSRFKILDILKNVFFAMAFMLISSLTFASNPNENVKLELKTVSKTETTVINIDFNSFADFNSFNPEQLNVSEDFCTTSISVTVSVGVGSTYESTAITAEGVACDEVGATIKKIKAQAITALD